MAKRKSTFFTKVEELRDWQNVAELGRGIIKDLQATPHDKTLECWMSHYVAELMEGEKKAKNRRERELLRKECSDVILRIWQIHRHFDPNDPINRINQSLDILVTGQRVPWMVPSEYASQGERVKRKTKKQKYDEVLVEIMALADEEKYIVFAAGTADLPAELPSEFQENKSGSKGKVDVEQYKRLISTRDTFVANSKSQEIKAIAEAKTKSVRKQAVAKALKKVTQKREALIKMIS